MRQNYLLKNYCIFTVNTDTTLRVLHDHFDHGKVLVATDDNVGYLEQIASTLLSEDKISSYSIVKCVVLRG